MKTVEEMIKVMQAYADGKKIENSLNGSCTKTWTDCDNPKWDWDFCDFRVKKEPTYRPYESVDEMLDDFCERCKEHGIEAARSPMGEPLIWLLSRGSTSLRLVTAFYKEQDGVRLYDGCLTTMQDLFDGYRYKDGSPCGKKVEE